MLAKATSSIEPVTPSLLTLLWVETEKEITIGKRWVAEAEISSCAVKWAVIMLTLRRTIWLSIAPKQSEYNTESVPLLALRYKCCLR